jgi:3-methyladenine DNA glycosylase Mpg
MESYILNKTSISPEDFDHVADLILNKTIIQANGSEFRICEIEFYLKNNEHNDEYVHQNLDQLEYGKCYFHKYKGKGYKCGTYKGLDITLGTDSTYCGILIRSLYDLTDKKMIEGPCRSVNRILELYGCSKVIEFTSGKLLSILENDKNFTIKDRSLDTEPIYKGKRVGLSDKYPEFRDRPYRYLIKKNEIKKQKSDLKCL